VKRAARLLAFALVGLGGLGAGRAAADERYFALIVGYNGTPAGPAGEALKTLRYADDDALSFYELEREAGSDAIVLTVPDSETRRRYPLAADVARPPTAAEMAQAIAALNGRMDAAARAGHTPVFVFFYSGHGSRHQETEAALTLLDGPLSQSALHEQVLDQVHAQTTHLIVDACHAEAVVRPRDVDAKTADVTPADLVAQLSAATAARYPKVGLVIATSGANPAHEWDLYQSGVFTHEVISGLRGAADVNHDGRIEYSELGAFLNAANREVVDPRARLQSIVQPPAVRAHAALIRLDARTAAGWLTAIPSSAGQFFVEDLRGNRILDGHAELGFSMSVAVPPNEPLFVRNGDREAELFVPAGVQKRFDALTFRGRPIRARGAMESALAAGLFLMPYGPGYYNGYVDRRDAVAVAPDVGAGLAPDAAETSSPRRATVWTLRGASAALLASSLVFGGLSWGARSDFDSAPTQRQASDASDRFKLDTTLGFTFLGAGVACAAASYLLGRHP
jgi:hypothetical protein